MRLRGGASEVLGGEERTLIEAVAGAPTSLEGRQLDRQRPRARVHPGQRQLRSRVPGLEDLLGGDLAEAAVIPLVGDVIPGQGLLSELDRHLLVGDPDRGLVVRYPTFPVDPPVPEADVSLQVNAPNTPDRREAARQRLIVKDSPF